MLCLLLPLQAQVNSLSSVLSVAPPEKLIVKRGNSVNVSIPIQLRQGYHVNSNAPADPYLIPLKVTLTSNAVEVSDIDYPKPQMMKLGFSDKPVSVFEGDFVLETKLKVGAETMPGLTQVMGKVRYQACNDKMCLPPRTLDFKVPVDIRQ